MVKEQADYLSIPVTAFITFTSSEGYERCEKYLFQRDPSGKVNHNYRKLKLLGEDVVLTAAPEPSNIVWENLDVSKA